MGVDGAAVWAIMRVVAAGEIRGMISSVDGPPVGVGRAVTTCGPRRAFVMCAAHRSASPAVTEYKQVTVLFVDVVGSMKLAAVLHPERLREIMNELFNRAAAVVQRYQGTLDKFTGDGLMALFGAPVALEDHALRACISALEIQSVTRISPSRCFAVMVFAWRFASASTLVRSSPARWVRVRANTRRWDTRWVWRSGWSRPHRTGGVLCSLSTARLVEGAAQLGPVEEVAIKGADSRCLHVGCSRWSRAGWLWVATKV